MPANRKKVLMLIENHPYPQDIRVNREAHTLLEAGYTVSVIAPAKKGQPVHEQIEGINIYRFALPSFPSNAIGYLLEYGYALLALFFLSLEVLFTQGFTILHLNNPPDILILIAGLYKLIGKKIVFDHHDLAPELFAVKFGVSGTSKKILHKLLLFFESLSVHLADKIISTNESYRSLVRTRNKLPLQKFSVVRNAPTLNPGEKVSPMLDIAEKAGVIIGYGGSISNQDGLDHLIRALASLEFDLGFSDYFAVIVGDGDDLSSVCSLADELGISNRVLFTGWQERQDYLRYLASTHICVVPDPSNFYNDRSTMIKAMDYMALGKPIVAYDMPEHKVSAGGAALYASPNDTKDLAKCIEVLASNMKLRNSLGETGLERIEKILAWKFQQEELLKVYASLI
ncbi:MAG: glycosyltransferase family 4 protein [Anaerolineales bacterium]|nr:glycosyltransferase family 4 protein [Anaerolineales bacterium]